MSSCLKAYGGSKEFLTTFNPGMQFKYCADARRCFMGTAPTLITTKLAYGEDVAVSWIAIQLRDLSEFAGCKEKLSIHQIEQIAQVIMLSFGFIKVTELMYFFVLFKSGKFGKFYGAVDGLVITEALREFLVIRRDKLQAYYEILDKQKREQERIESEKNCMTREEWDEIKWMFNMGYEPERIKAELAEQRKAENNK